MNNGNASGIRNSSGAVEQPRHLTVSQAAKALNMAQSTIRVWIGKRKIGVVRLGRAIRVPADEITRLVEEGSIPARRS